MSNPDHPHPDHPDDRLAELEAMEREQDRKRHERQRDLAAQLADPRVQLGIEALVRDWIEEQSAKIAASLSDTNARQLQRLALRLVELDLLDLEDDPDEEIEFGTVNDLVNGVVVTAIAFGESTYWEDGRELIEQKEAAGRTLYRYIGPDGEPGPWNDAPPPPSRSEGN